MKHFSYPLIVSSAVVCLLISGCNRNISPDVYSESHVGESMISYRGVIANVRKVTVKGQEKLEESTAGIAAGGILGGVAGYQFGKGGGNVAATALGAVGGAVAGALIQDAIKTQEGLEYVVHLDNGEMRTVVQGLENPLSVGQRVMLIEGKQGRSRVMPDNSGY